MRGQILGAFGVDFGPDFGDLLIQHEHVLTVILCQLTFLFVGRQVARTAVFFKCFLRLCLRDETMTYLFFPKNPARHSVANCIALWKPMEV